MGPFLIVGSCFVGLILYKLITQPQRLHVKVKPMEMKVMGINIMPIIVFLINQLPEGMRRNKVTKKVRTVEFVI